MFRTAYFQKKLFIYYSIVVTIIIASSILAFYQYIIKTTEGQAIENLEQLAIKTSDQVDSLFKSMDQVALQVMTNPRVIDIMSGIQERDADNNFFDEDLVTAREMTRILLSINGPNLSASRVSVYNKRGDYIGFGRFTESTDRLYAYLHSKQLDFQYEKLDALRGKRLIVPPHADIWSNKEEIRLISVVRMIKSLPFEKNYGMVEVQQPDKMLTDLLEIKGLKTILFSDSGEIVASSGRADRELSVDEKKRYFHENSAGNGKFQEQIATDLENDKQEVVVAVRSDFSNQLLVFVQSRNELFATKRTVVQILLFSGISLVVVTLIIIFFISQNLTKPLRQLRKSMDKVTLGNLSIDFDQTGSRNEFTLLTRAFDAMFRRLNESMTQEIKAHMLALQSQMNPHFLYNMLTVISSTAEESSNESIMNMCHKLSRMLRYVSSFDETEVTLMSELEHTVNYLSLMKERYEDYFSYTIEVDEQAAVNVKIPKLILQPIVENCFHHGFQAISPPWFVHVCVRISESAWSLEISDNGAGFDEQAIQNLDQKIQETMLHSSIHMDGLKIGGLGLVNTIVRLKLLYKGDFEFHIESNKPRGTKIVLKGMIK